MRLCKCRKPQPKQNRKGADVCQVCGRYILPRSGQPFPAGNADAPIAAHRDPDHCDRCGARVRRTRCPFCD